MNQQKLPRVEEVLPEFKETYSSSEWNKKIHLIFEEVLAPRGYTEHQSGHTIANIDFLTQAKIKYLSNVSKTFLDEFVANLLKECKEQMSDGEYRSLQRTIITVLPKPYKP